MPPISSSVSESRLREELDPECGRYILEICRGGPFEEVGSLYLGECKTYLASPTIVPFEMIGNVEANSGPQEIDLPNSDVI